jgi:hypothetical protein
VYKRIYATLIGDLVGSRGFPGRVDLQRAVNRSLVAVNDAFSPVQPLEPTVGDELQGAFRSPASAVGASLVLRLRLLQECEMDARFGLGYGTVTVFQDRTPISQDGPGWWSARTAIERAEKMGAASHTAFVRTCFDSASSDSAEAHGPSDVGAWNAFLVSRDALVGQMKPRSRRLLLGLLLDKTQAELAVEEGISQSAVSQNLAHSGAYAVMAAERELKEAR